VVVDIVREAASVRAGADIGVQSVTSTEEYCRGDRANGDGPPTEQTDAGGCQETYPPSGHPIGLDWFSHAKGQKTHWFATQRGAPNAGQLHSGPVPWGTVASADS
jgi:hypothetical protein